MPLGTISKLVRTAVMGQSEPSLAEEMVGEGYGIILGESGEQVFFVDSVVQGGAFEGLAIGQSVEYALEEGPLLRASAVAVEEVRRPEEKY
jgi:cold shock CspA family protein